MKFSEAWLREFVDPPVSSVELLEQLTMAGLEVEGIVSCDREFSGVVVGRVEKLERHPASDKLRVCQVNTGQAHLHTVVCGAENVQSGGSYPFAQIGAILPGAVMISKTEIRGVVSEGMLCSEKELGLAEQSSGIFELGEDTKPGTDIKKYLGLDDSVIEISLTPNRGDCLSLAGIAREVAVLNKLAFSRNQVPAIAATIKDARLVQLVATEACPHYCGRIISNIDAGKPTPVWVSERLRRSDIRSINAIVDLTNYVMLETGQPMHAFDNDRLEGDIQIRLAQDSEQLVLLDGQSCKLAVNTLAICDKSGPVAMAGIMGGLDTAVTETTRTLFIESAFFSPLAIMGRARQYGLHTDASHRYERGVDPQLCKSAMERLTGLILGVCGGQAGPVIDAVDQGHLPTVKTVILRSDRVERVLGLKVEHVQIREILTQLGFQLTDILNGWEVTVPSHRFDIELETDLIEEIARIYGYGNIAGTTPVVGMRLRRADNTNTLIQQMRHTLTVRGYREAITYSFVDPGMQSLLLGEGNPIPLFNPISSDMAVMRQSLWVGLIQTLTYNLKRQQQRVRLLETGKVFNSVSQLSETRMVAGVTYGNIYPKQWDIDNKSSDFYDLKSDIEAILQSCIDIAELEYKNAGHNALHPGQSAAVYHNGEKLGVMGALHPAILHRCGLHQPAWLFEIDLSRITPKTTVNYQKISKYPSIKRDIAIVVDTTIPVIDILNFIKNSQVEIFRNLELFDVYQGEGIDLGKKSLALGLTFQRSSSTLTDEEADTAVGSILNALYKQFRATLRE